MSPDELMNLTNTYSREALSYSDTHRHSTLRNLSPQTCAQTTGEYCGCIYGMTCVVHLGPLQVVRAKKPMLCLKIKITTTNKTIKNLLKTQKLKNINNKKLTNYIIRDDRGDCPPRWESPSLGECVEIGAHEEAAVWRVGHLVGGGPAVRGLGGGNGIGPAPSYQGGGEDGTALGCGQRYVQKTLQKYFSDIFCETLRICAQFWTRILHRPRFSPNWTGSGSWDDTRLNRGSPTLDRQHSVVWVSNIEKINRL